MKSRVAAGFLILLILTAIIALIVLIVSNLNEKEQRNITKQHLPNFNLFLVDSALINNAIPSHRFTIIIFFNSSCEYCSYEAREVRNHLEKLAEATILFVSTEPLDLIKKFGKEHGLCEYPNIYLSKISSADASRIYGRLAIPHIFVYDSNQILVQEFRGETKIETILKCIGQ